MQHPLAAAFERFRTVIGRRPEFAVQDDSPAIARWEHGTRVVSSHSAGHSMVTDMPAELGGEGLHATPGWMFRAGVASCFATCIVIAAAEQGIKLSALEVVAESTTDARGMLGLPDSDGSAVPAGARELRLKVSIAAAGVEPERLRRLVQDTHRLAPMSSNVERAVPMVLDVAVGSA